MADTQPRNSASTEYSKQRYAHPFFLPAPQAARQPIHGQTHMTDWSKLQLGPVPPVRHGGKMDLAALNGAEGVKEIEQAGEIRFHALGDTGVGHAAEAENISDEMATDYKPGAGGLNPAALLHLGDIIYGPDKAAHYADRFYRPYRHYPGKIIAIPGNHDGEAKTAADNPSLKDFLANFCASSAVVPPHAADSGIYRETMTQPGAYWLLEAPFVRIIGLYSNRLENPGYLEAISNGKGDTSQVEWLTKTLARIAKEKEKKALVIAAHHPPFSQGGHSASKEMSLTIDSACLEAGVTPDLFLAGHAHNYQRYTRRIGNKQVVYIVAGTGGMPPQHVAPATGQPVEGHDDLTYDSAIACYGYLFITVSASHLKTEFWQLGKEHTKAFDAVTVDLNTHAVN